MRIGLIVPGFSADEADWCIPSLRHLVRGLADGADVRVLALRYPHRAGAYPLLGARVMALGGGTLRGAGSARLWAAALAWLAREHRRAPFDVLHAFWATESGALAALAGRTLGVPTVISVAGGELAALPAIGYGGQLARAERAKVRLALRLATVVAAGSLFAARQAERAAGRPVRQLPLGVDTGLFSEGAGESAGPPRIVHAASLVPVKAQRDLLGALGLLAARGEPFTLDVAGVGPLEATLRARAAELGIAGRVRFLGAVPHDALPALMRGAAAFALSSLHEAQCMALLEAAACGVPAAGAAVGALPELAPGAAAAAPPGDVAALAAALAEILADPRRRAAMGAEAARVARERYSAEASAAAARAAYAAAGA